MRGKPHIFTQVITILAAQFKSKSTQITHIDKWQLHVRYLFEHCFLHCIFHFIFHKHCYKCLGYFHFYSGTFHKLIFLYLISCTKLLFEFFSWQQIFCEVWSVGKHCFQQQNINKMKFIINASNIPYYLEQVYVPYVSTYLLFCTYSLISKKKHNSHTKHITP